MTKETPWAIMEASNRVALDLYDPLANGRTAEPVELTLHLGSVQPADGGIVVVDDAGRTILTQIVAKSREFATLCFNADVRPGATGRRYHVYLSGSSLSQPHGGISQLAPLLADGVRRLNTGTYEFELCRGTGQGDGGSKWGIRDFQHTAQRIGLIAGNANAWGGVYGPFFTPENGLVNPPAHMVIAVEPVAEGPVLCRYRMHGTIPDGLRPELRGKRLEIIWTFYNRSHWFDRTYRLDDFETTIDGKLCRNRMTVGDEIESGKGQLLLSSYMHAGGTRYRQGDQYHRLLLSCIDDLRRREPEGVAAAMQKLGIDPGEETSRWHWDNYWRLFSVIEAVLPPHLLEREVELISRKANEAVWSDAAHAKVHAADGFIDVSAVPEQSIFPFDARKTCAHSAASGFSFIHVVNRTVARMNIIQRQDSGWVNWGTNGENEYPELPSGATIRAAYGQFDDWEEEANRMGGPLAVAVGPLEWR